MEFMWAFTSGFWSVASFLFTAVLCVSLVLGILMAVASTFDE